MNQGWKCPTCGRVWSPLFDGPCTCTPRCPPHDFDGASDHSVTGGRYCRRCGTPER